MKSPVPIRSNAQGTREERQAWIRQRQQSKWKPGRKPQPELKTITEPEQLDITRKLYHRLVQKDFGRWAAMWIDNGKITFKRELLDEPRPISWEEAKALLAEPSQRKARA